MTMKMGEDRFKQFALNQTDTLAGTSQELIAQIDGFIVGLDVIVQTAVTTGGTVTVSINGTAVNGLSVAVANGATKGTRYSDKPTAQHASQTVKKGDRIQVVPAGFASAGAISGYLTINSGQLA